MDLLRRLQFLTPYKGWLYIGSEKAGVIKKGSFLGVKYSSKSYIPIRSLSIAYLKILFPASNKPSIRYKRQVIEHCLTRKDIYLDLTVHDGEALVIERKTVRSWTDILMFESHFSRQYKGKFMNLQAISALDRSHVGSLTTLCNMVLSGCVNPQSHRPGCEISTVSLYIENGKAKGWAYIQEQPARIFRLEESPVDEGYPTLLECKQACREYALLKEKK